MLTPRVDLRAVPYSIPGSRLLVTLNHNVLTVCRAVYESRLSDCVVVEDLGITVAGKQCQVEDVNEYGVFFTAGIRAFLHQETLVIHGLPTGAVVEWIEDGSRRRLEAESTTISVGGKPVASDAVHQHDQAVSAWMQQCPVADELGALGWWVLGVNTLQFDLPTGSYRGVVPSKAGYVGVWQWDAYFIAMGLAHGNLPLAREQLRMVLGHIRPDGQLPDVVHDEGILASSDDLPEGDLENLRKLGSPTLGNSTVPLTKPPLGAVAVDAVGRYDATVIDEFLDVLVRNQQWWFTHSSRDGVPVYLHPYSSGLDDSPVFDTCGMPVSPDLLAYLILSEDLIGKWLTQRGRADEAVESEARRRIAYNALLHLWNPTRGMFECHNESGEPISSETVVSLMPLLVPDLPADCVEQLVANVQDPQRFGTTYVIPTVAANDRDFDPERMWRGPVWLNTNWLVARGLRTHGYEQLAQEIEDSSLELARRGGTSEYYDCLRGVKAPRAVVSFGWSAALVVDILVRRKER